MWADQPRGEPVSPSDRTVVSFERQERIKYKGEEWVEGSTPAETRGSSREQRGRSRLQGSQEHHTPHLYFLRVGSATTVLAGKQKWPNFSFRVNWFRSFPDLFGNGWERGDFCLKVGLLILPSN